MNSLLHFLWPAGNPPVSHAAWLAAEPRTAQRRDQCPGATPPFSFFCIIILLWHYGTCVNVDAYERFHRRLKCRSGPRLLPGAFSCPPGHMGSGRAFTPPGRREMAEHI